MVGRGLSDRNLYPAWLLGRGFAVSQEYESSESKRFALAVEQLEQCAELIEDGSIPKLRMAIVLLDNLADTFLYRRCLSHITRAHQQSIDLVEKRRLPKARFKDLQRSFTAKLEFVAEIDSSGKGRGYRLTRADVDLLSIGHSYRNAIYHRDSHNPAVIPVLARLLFSATARLFQITTSSSVWGQQSDSTTSDLEPIRDYGVLDPDRTFWPHKAAANVARLLQERISQDSATAIATLAADLETRSHQLKDLAGTLQSVERVLPWAEFWDLYGYDDQLVRLADLGDRWRRHDELMVNPEEVWADISEAEEQLTARVKHLWSSFTPQVSLDEIQRAARVAKGLSVQDNIATTIHAYHEVDRRLSRLERYLWEIELEYDRKADLEYEIWRESH
jgi:hypothetical protein